MGKGNGHHIPNTPIVVDYWTIKGVPPKCVRFLTHMHSDHIEGLTRQFPYRIYCTPVTARLLRQKFSFAYELLVELDYDQPMTVYVESVSGPQHHFTATAFDAQHCPGSAMFLFEGEFGTILYTGDFRYEADKEGQYPELAFMSGRKSIDVLYLDNTYCDPSCKFPPRTSVTQDIVSTIQQFFASHHKGQVVFGMDTLGKESLLCHVAVSLGLPIGVTQERLERLALMGLSDFFTDDLDGVRIRLVQNRGINDRVIREWTSEAETMVILPTARYSGPGGIPFNLSSPCVHVFLYSDHCSWDELHHFVRAVSPKKIIPVVQFRSSTTASNTRCNMEVFRQYLDPAPLPPCLAGGDTVMDKSYLLDAPKHSVPRVPKKRLSDPGTTASKSKSRHRGVQYASPGKGSSPKHPGGVKQVKASPLYRVVNIKSCNMWDRTDVQREMEPRDEVEDVTFTFLSSSNKQDAKSKTPMVNGSDVSSDNILDFCSEDDGGEWMECKTANTDSGSNAECASSCSTTRKLPNSILASLDRRHCLSVGSGLNDGDIASSREAHETKVTEESRGGSPLLDSAAVNSLHISEVMNEDSKECTVMETDLSEAGLLGGSSTENQQCRSQEHDFVVEHASSVIQCECFIPLSPTTGTPAAVPAESCSMCARLYQLPAPDGSLSATGAVTRSPNTPSQTQQSPTDGPGLRSSTPVIFQSPPDASAWISPILTASNSPKLLMFTDHRKQHSLVKGMMAEVEEYRRLRKLKRQGLLTQRASTC